MRQCPHCQSTKIIKKSFYFIKALRSYKRRYYCKTCEKSFSSQTKHPTRYQKKPYLNLKLLELLLQGNTLRGSAKLLGCARATTDNKYKWLMQYHDVDLNSFNSTTIQIDEMESIEHTKLKPLTIPLCVSDKYEIIAVNVGKIPAKGHLADLALKKYGFRANERELTLRKLFEEVRSRLAEPPQKVITDGAPIYKTLVKEYFPEAEHQVVISRGQKEKKRERLFELKHKKVFDPMFALNQRCAKLRANIRRLTRRSWCTTKRVDHLYYHLKFFQNQNNQEIKALV